MTDRLGRLLPALTGRERAILALHAYKEKRPPQQPWAMGDADTRVYNHLVGIIGLVNEELADIVLILREQVTQAELRFGVLQLARLRAEDLWMVRRYLDECTKEPVTKSELKKRHRPSQGFDIRPDEDADEVAALRKNRDLMRRFLEGGCEVELPLDLRDLPEEPATVLDGIRLLAACVRDNLASCWTQLCAVETVVAEYAEEFRGEDPLLPASREALDGAKERTVALKDQLLAYLGEWELPEDHDEALAMVRLLAERVL